MTAAKVTTGMIHIGTKSVVIGACPLAIASILLFLALLPVKGLGWLAGFTEIPIENCVAVPSCVNETIHFEVTVTPFYASMLFGSGGSSAVQSVTWTALNAQNMCGSPNSQLHKNYAVPNAICNDQSQFFSPKAVNVAQAMTVLAVTISAAAVALAIAIKMTDLVGLVWMFYAMTTCALVSSVIAIVVWDLFTVPVTYLNGSATSFPMWNATILSNGRDSFGIEFSDVLVGSPNAQAVTKSRGVDLWIAGLSFLSLAQCISFIGCIANCMTLWREREEGTFGSGVYDPKAAYSPVCTNTEAGSRDFVASKGE